jgi:hypothetical protein
MDEFRAGERAEGSGTAVDYDEGLADQRAGERTTGGSATDSGAKNPNQFRGR